jgi:hypothetical protein
MIERDMTSDKNTVTNNNTPANHDKQMGQALVEYALILTLVVISFGVALAATGPIVGNIFDNTVTNLIGSNIEFEGQLPDSEEFWLTVTWVATQTPAEVPLPTRTLPPPSATPTFGPSPTPTPITPTKTYTPTNTPTPSPTPEDIIHPLGFTDTAEIPLHWRIDDTFYTGSGQWHAIFYRNRDLTPTGNEERAIFDNISFDWGSGAPADDYPADDWGAVFRRQFYLQQKTTLNFDIPVTNNGVRIWILGGSYGGNPDVMNGSPGTCADSDPLTNGRRAGGLGDTSDRNWNRGTRVFDDQAFGYNPASDPDGDIPTSCLILDRWKHGDESSYYGLQRTIPAGLYTIMIEFYEQNGTARLGVDIGSASGSINPDDRRVNASGTDAGLNAQCGWNDYQHPDLPNSLDYMWDEYTNGGFPAGNRCYLELRGAVDIPAGTTSPMLTFWDVWDIRDGTSAWVEVADYDPDDDGIFDRSALTWNRIDLHSDNSFNYNWTYQSVDLSAYAGRKVTFRFGMQNNSSTSTNKWKIDTIRVDTTEYPDLYTNLRWNLDAPEQKDEFITSGHWALTGENTIGGVGLAFHESPGRDYDRWNSVRNNSTSNYEDGNMRMHTIEFKGFIDLTLADGLVDDEGDSGDPILTFFHMYELDDRTGLEVQYTTDPYGTANPTWSVAPGGQIVVRNHTNNLDVDIFEEVEVNLADIGESRFRLRLAMVVHPRAQTDPGWWIDEIQLQRAGLPKFTRFPFVDTAEDPLSMDKWLRLGTWNRIEGGRRPAGGTTGWSYHDSPSGDYQDYSENSMTLLDGFDMYLDTPENAWSPACVLGVDCEATPDVAPVDPIMTFWHYRDFQRDADFYVEWKRTNEDNDSWRKIWAYEDRMRTEGTGYDDSTLTQLHWERVEIDLTPMMNVLAANDDPADPYDDDIIFRFRMSNPSSRNDDGVWIDDIRIEERVERVFYLWDAGTTATDSGGSTINVVNQVTPALGDGLEYYDGLDNNPDLFTGAWHYGGDWNTITWDQWSGIFSFHDSPDFQTEPPPDNSTPITDTLHASYSVLEMATIIDLRGVDITDRPTLTFWQKYEVGDDDRISVEVSYQDPNNIDEANCRSSLPQCYEKLYGWSEWETLYDQYDYDRNYLWHQKQISLETYAAQTGRDGYRIRLRFVVDALDRTNTWDGWYIDDIRIKYFDYDLTRTPINKVQPGATFFDSARNTRNWVTEGNWGLSPEFFRGAGGGPASLGASVWSYRYYDLDDCPPESGRPVWDDVRDCATGLFNNGEYDVNVASSGIVLEINNDWRRGGPAGLRDNFAGRWTLTTGEVGPAVNAGTYTFITTTDDGVRMKYDTYPTPGGLPAPVEADDPAQSGWNIINNWTYHGRTVDMGIAKLAAGNRYQFVLEWFEGGGDATMILSTGSNKFSFTDSPKQGSGLAFPDVKAQGRSNSSLVYDGVFDFSQADNPILQYYTYYELGGTARVEVSPDGGFTWTQEGLRGRNPTDIWDGGWTVEYYNDRDLDFDGDSPVVTQTLADNVDLSFNWGNNRPATGVNSNNFSSRWTRDITLTETMTINFRLRHDDGARLWIEYTPGCITEPGITVFSGQNNPSGLGNNQSWATGCLIINDWRSGNRTTTTRSRTLGPGTYTIQVDQYEGSGGARIELETWVDGFDGPSYNGTYMPNNGDWRERIHDLTDYAGAAQFNNVALRFRLDRVNERIASEGNDFQRTNQSPVNWMEGWWIVDILITDP